MQPFTLKTGDMAKYLGLSPDFLKKNIGVTFFEGVHYFRPKGINSYMWKVEEMQKWVMNQTITPKAKEVLKNII